MDPEEFFNHHAAVLEFDAGMHRNEAERIAKLELIEHLKVDHGDVKAKEMAQAVWLQNRTLNVL